MENGGSYSRMFWFAKPAVDFQCAVHVGFTVCRIDEVDLFTRITRGQAVAGVGGSGERVLGILGRFSSDLRRIGRHG